MPEGQRGDVDDMGEATQSTGEGVDQLGAPLHEGAGGSRPRVGPRSWYRDALLLSTVIGALLVDQVSKYLVRANLRPYESWPEDGLIRLTHGTNTGTAFGLFPNQTSILIVLSLVAIGFLYYFYRTHALPSRLLRLAIGLQLGGAFGNLFDRLKDGAVVDFIDAGWWPTFNLADSSIVIGITLLLTVMLFRNDEPERPGAPGGAAE